MLGVIVFAAITILTLALMSGAKAARERGDLMAARQQEWK